VVPNFQNYTAFVFSVEKVRYGSGTKHLEKLKVNWEKREGRIHARRFKGVFIREFCIPDPSRSVPVIIWFQVSGSSPYGTVKRGKIGHLIPNKSRLKIVRSVFCEFFLQNSLYELWDPWLQSLNHWFCAQGYHFFLKNHWCPILPKVGLRSDTTLNHDIN